MKAVDLNSDVGEGPGEEPIYEFITSANIACGGHAGDESTMEAAVRLAKSHGVTVGAHPSFPDRRNFGRVALAMPAQQIEELVHSQVLALAEIASDLGWPLRHVKPHGALYTRSWRDATVAEAIARGVARLDPRLVLVGLAGTPCLGTWRALGFAVAGEGFADRTYEPDGTLRSRAFADALITDPARAGEQAVTLARRDDVRTICVHSDTPGAAAIVAAAREALRLGGFEVAPLDLTA